MDAILEHRRQALSHNNAAIAELAADNDTLAEEIDHALRVKEKIEALTA